jgi:tetratricopeptide (TPR) repeat protein
LTSLLFHLANSVLLFLILRRMTREMWPSAAVAALFALHPLRVESVAWVSERKDVLSTLFWMLTVWAYLGYVSRVVAAQSVSVQRNAPARGSARRSSPPNPGPAASWNSRFMLYSLALGFFALGLMSKPMLVSLPFVLLLLDYWPLRRLQIQDVAAPNAPAASGGSAPARGARLKLYLTTLAPLVAEKIPFFVLSLGSCVVTFLVQRRGGAVSTSLSLSARLANAVVSYARYLGKTFWPARLSVLYPHPGHWPAGAVIGALALLALITGWVIWRARRQPYLVVGWLWFVVMLAPTIGLVQVGVQSMADRYTYLPQAGIFIMLVWGLDELLGGQVFGIFVRALGVALAVAVCAILTARQIAYWDDSGTLFQHAVEVTDNNYLAYNNLGFFLSNKGEAAQAMRYYQRALQINPNFDEAHNNLGFALAGQGRNSEAISEYQAALRLNPGLTEAHNNYGNALANVGRVEDAIREYLTALEENPHHAGTHNNLGNALAQRGQLDQAIEQFRQAIRDQDNYVGAHSNLGNAYAIQGKFDQAVEQYRIALQLDPSEPQAHNNLANVLAQQGKFDEAIKRYMLALKLKPENPEAHFNLAYCLAKQGRRAQAEAHYIEALRQRPDYPQARQQLAALRANK